MKLTGKIVFIFAVLAIAGVILDRMDEKKPEVVIDLSPDTEAIELCYLWNTNAGDKAMLSMDIRDENVIGEFYWLPLEKDSKTGVFKGTVASSGGGGTVDGWWEAMGEGITVKEEIKIKFDENTAGVGFGEMVDRGDRTYVYKDPGNLSYAPPLQRTDCGDEAMD